MSVSTVPDRDPSGNLLLPMSPPFSSSNSFRIRYKGISGVAVKESVTSIDYKLVEERWINGVQLILRNHVFGDSVKLQVVDVENVLGYGVNLVLDEFGDSWYVDNNKQDQGKIITDYPARLVSNLYLRIVYTSTGSVNDVDVRANLFLHKRL